MKTSADVHRPDGDAVSVCMIARNEAACIERCLYSLKPLNAEIIVVDTGSTDGTQDIARRFGAQVIETPWKQDFSHARNLGIDRAKGRWILIIDSDEYLLPGDVEKIREIIGERQRAEATPIAYELLQASPVGLSPGRILVSIVRLFPRHPAVRYEWPVHEQVVDSLTRQGIRILPSKIEIQHTGYADPIVNRAKQSRNLEILKKQLADPLTSNAHVAFLAAGAYLDLGNYTEALNIYRSVPRYPNAPRDLIDGARVRTVTCLLRLKLHDDAMTEFPAAWDGAWHPELVKYRAEVDYALGRRDEALVWNERVLNCKESAYIPPCNLTSLKLGALTSIAQIWKEANRAPLAIAILRKAKELMTNGEVIEKVTLDGIYTTFGGRPRIDGRPGGQ